MKNLPRHLASLTATAWVGSLWAVGYLAVPVLFHAQPDKQLAGMLAGQMFTSAGYLGLFCALYLLWYHLGRPDDPAARRRLLLAIASMLALNLVILFGLQPAIADLKAQALPLDIAQSGLYGKFRMLHGISSIAYLIESLLGVYLVAKRS